jgi:hypothetical protein
MGSGIYPSFWRRVVSFMPWPLGPWYPFSSMGVLAEAVWNAVKGRHDLAAEGTYVPAHYVPPVPEKVHYEANWLCSSLSQWFTYW